MKTLKLVYVLLLAFTVISFSESIVYSENYYHALGVSGCSACHRFQDGTCCECDNIKGIRCSISIPNYPDGEDPERVVVFTSRTGTNSFADGDATYDGVCEVCHTETNHHTNDGHPSDHRAGDDCILCHKHTDEFMPVPPPAP